jgi:V8-like Glu-specific endopeptidase
MKNKFLILLLTLCYAQSLARIFGTDDRVEAFTQPKLEKSIAGSVAIMLSPIFLKEQADIFELDFNLISDSYEIALCPSEKFYGQPTASVNCTGFLVDENLLLTAGHCVLYANTEVKNSVTPQCKDFVWAFDYKYKTSSKIDMFFPKENVFKCSEVVYGKFQHIPQSQNFPSPQYGDDIALIKLERKANRTPLVLSGKISNNEKVFTIGYPSGLPQKITLNGKIKSSTPNNYFTSTLDVFGGNSGGPVFNQNNEVLGVIVRSFPSKDYTYLKTKECSVPDRCSQSLKNCDIPNQQKVEDEYTHAQKISDFISSLILNSGQE